MQLLKFQNQNTVEMEAERVVNKILADRSYTNPEKISLLISEYEKKQTRLDAQLSKGIKSQIQCIMQSKQSVSQANRQMQLANEKTDIIREAWNQQLQFHQVMENVITLNLFQKNVGTVIEQLSYFIDMDNQMMRLQKWAEDQNKYLLINSKLLSLIQLRNALLEDATWQRESAIMKKYFVKVDNFEISFYDRVFQNFANCLQVAKKAPQSLIISVKVIQAYDKALLQKGKQRVMRDRAIEVINSSIDQRFIDKLSEEDQLIGVIQKSKFAMTDLVELGDIVAPCFPISFGVMDIFQKRYKENIEKQIVPYFQQIQEENQYGHLVVLLGWIDDYETLLSRAGLDSTHLIGLKSKVKIMMPFFIQHNHRLIEDYINNCLSDDQKNYHRGFYQECIRDGSDLISTFPSDIFMFVNQEAEIIRNQLRGEIFMEFVRCIAECLNEFQKNLQISIMEELKVIREVQSQDRVLDFEYKVILFINNYNECLKHAGQSKELFSQMVNEEYKVRIQKIFMNQVQREFNYSIPHFIRVVVEVIFMKVIQETYPNLFSLNWLSDNSRQLMTLIMRTIADELNDVESQNLIINIIHYRMLVKESFQFLVNAYFEQLILFIHTIYNITAKGFELKYTNQMFTNKKIKENKDLNELRNIFNSKVTLSQAIKKDKHIFIKFADSFSQATSKAFMSKLTTKFVLVGELFMKKKTEFNSLRPKVEAAFPDCHASLINAVLIVRDDVESRAAYIPKKGMGLQMENY